MSSAEMVFDNRDPTLIASQEAAAATTDTTAGDGSAADLFGIAEEGAYLVVDAGRISFEGEVPDVATADLLRSAFVPLLGRGVEVTDNLVVTAGSPAPSGKVVVAGALLFDIGQDQLKSDPEVLDTIVDLMTVNPTWAMTITGHTDDVGDWLTNVELSLRRADNVRRRLVDLGIPEERLRVQGAGPEQPIGDNQTPEGRTMNRRIEISIDS
jgi:outer membrane protein OmpA-like peptidoglycan-associated protein